MTWELRDDNLEDPYQAGGEATYSNNKSIASSYATIFEIFWKQTEMSEQSQTSLKCKTSLSILQLMNYALRYNQSLIFHKFFFLREER